MEVFSLMILTTFAQLAIGAQQVLLQQLSVLIHIIKIKKGREFAKLV
jgi:hypothetical protein